MSVQDYGGSPKVDGPADAGSETTITPPPPRLEDPASSSPHWEWLNPSPTGETLHGIGGTSTKDIWVSGGGGTIAHFDGSKWDQRVTSGGRKRYVSIGARGPNDVWVAGESEGALSVVHFDGNEWTEAYSFAGAPLLTFSTGSPSRLFAVLGSGPLEWQILEASSDGGWKETDTSAGGFGPPVGVWVLPNGEAWALLRSATFLKLEAGSNRWQAALPVGLPPPAPAQPMLARALSLGGINGTTGCAFYTGAFGDDHKSGMLGFDGTTWRVVTSDTRELGGTGLASPLTCACLRNGSGLLPDSDTWFVKGSKTTTGFTTPHFDPYQGAALRAVWSPDGDRLFAVGTRGTFVTRRVDETRWVEAGPSVHHDLRDVGVGIDGAVVAVGISNDPSREDDALFRWDGAWTSMAASSGKITTPSLPHLVAPVSRNDVWLVSDGSASGIGVTHFNGAWGLTRFLDGGAVMSGMDALAAWAAGPNDVWVSGRRRCQKPPREECAKPTTAFLWHWNGTRWVTTPGAGAVQSIHGTGPNDVWFAGDGLYHWNGSAIRRVAGVAHRHTGVWSTKTGVWLWGDHASFFDGTREIPIVERLSAARDWVVSGIAEGASGDLFVIVKRGVGSTLLWFDPSRTKLREQVTSELELTKIAGRGDELWAVGEGGATLRFSHTQVH